MLAVRNLKKTWPSPGGGFTTVVDVREFTLAPAAQCALRGKSGSGKTAFLHLISGILTPDAGEVILGSSNTVGLSETKRDRLRAEGIGYVFQTFNLLQGCTALENVMLGMAFGAGTDRARAVGLLERMDLGGRLHHYPRQLSTGQQQRVALARAVAHRPKLVLADEPTGNLDPEHARTAIALLRECCREVQAALLVVSHDEQVLAQFEDRREFSEINRARP